jgi:hypothetical protein
MSKPRSETLNGHGLSCSNSNFGSLKHRLRDDDSDDPELQGGEMKIHHSCGNVLGTKHFKSVSLKLSKNTSASLLQLGIASTDMFSMMKGRL